jgi:hypothetical protein
MNDLFFDSEDVGVLHPWYASARLHGVIFNKMLLSDSVVVNFYYAPTELVDEEKLLIVFVIHELLKACFRFIWKHNLSSLHKRHFDAVLLTKIVPAHS